MEYRPLRLAAGLILAVWLPLAPASEPTPGQGADWEARLEAAKTAQQKGKAMRAEAKARYEADKKTCFNKFRVTDCQEDARRVYVNATNEARRVENQGLAAERQVRRERLADKDARSAAEAAERDAGLRQREAATAAERGDREARRQKKLAEKEKKAAEGERRHAREARRQHEKQARHEREVAEKMDKARQREAESGD